jgi:Signal transduction histidine kinase
MIPEEISSLRNSRIELQGVADFLPYPFIIAEVIDGQHLNTYLNEKFLEEIGYTLDEIPTIEAWYGKAYPDYDYRNNVITTWDDEETLSQQEGKVFVKSKSHVTCKNGTIRWYEVKACVINKIHIVAFIDLDKEIRFQEELKNINKNNDRMLSILGHDLRSPVANLMSISSMAANTEISPDEFASLIKMINEQSKQVLELLDNTLNWAKLNFNTIKLNLVEIDFRVLIANILEIYKTPCESKNISVKVAIKNFKINSDIEIVTIIIRNLISNAIKFTPQNGAIVIESFGNELSIKDNGIGMSQEMIEDILRNTNSSRRGTNNEQGTGVGLQLVVNLAEKINCSLAIASEESKGTKIRMTFK